MPSNIIKGKPFNPDDFEEWFVDPPLTMEDFADCIVTGPELNEVGYQGDYPQPLEYPCNCLACKRIWEKQVSRDEDQRRLDAGEITREELTRENSWLPLEYMGKIDFAKLKIPKRY